jgi:hypothetical protein
LWSDHVTGTADPQLDVIGQAPENVVTGREIKDSALLISASSEKIRVLDRCFRNFCQILSHRHDFLDLLNLSSPQPQIAP